jgi:hypothetical protein
MFSLASYAFKQCEKLTSVTLPSSLKHIEDDAFKYSYALRSIVIPTSVETIGDEAFHSSGIDDLIIPANVSFVGINSFQLCPNLKQVVIKSQNLTFGSGVFEGCSNLEANKVYYRKNFLARGTEFAGEKVGLRCTSGSYADYGADRRCGCKEGFGNNMTSNSSYFNCVPCGVGQTSLIANQAACDDCIAGRYANEQGQRGCTLCSTGKYYDKVGAKSAEMCRECDTGKYAATPGAKECIDCPPGTFCNSTGQSNYHLCDAGDYTKYSRSTNCTACPAGTYQTEPGSAYCHPCPMGTYSLYQGLASNESATCKDCPAGKYGDKKGLSECTFCPTGQYQGGKGQSMCHSCSERDKLMTNTPDYTDCMVNQALMSDSLVEVMFSNGTAYVVSFAISAVFVFVCGFMQRNRVKAGGGLGQLSRLQVVLKSALPGFSFGSEMFLVAGMMHEAPGLAAVMIFFRSMHPITTMYVLVCLFADVEMTTKVLVSDSDKWKDAVHFEFARVNISAVVGVTLLSLCDVPMVRMMPWKDSDFYKESNGFPSMSLMRLCLGVETIQSTVSVICQIVFLSDFHDINDPLMSTQAKILFGLNILFSSVTVIISLVMLFFKNLLLKQKQSEPDALVISSGLELGNIYQGNESSSTLDNPLHQNEGSGDMQAEIPGLKDKVKSLEDENAGLKDTVAGLKGDKEMLNGEIQRLKAEKDADAQHAL